MRSRPTVCVHLVPALLVVLLLTAALAVGRAEALESPSAVDLQEPMLLADPTLTWNTFLGATSHDSADAVVSDSSGNLYVVGGSVASWGSPIRPHDPNYSADAFVAKLSPAGALLWVTFLGGEDADKGTALALDDSGNVYVAGTSSATWGAPSSAYSGSNDAFLAKLAPSGTLLWHTFLGGEDWDDGFALAMNDSGEAYIGGQSWESWGTPVRSHSGGPDAFIAKVSSAGSLAWVTFLGSSDGDYARALALDDVGDVYVCGHSMTSWGSPLRPHDPNYSADAFVGKISPAGVLAWHSFLGGADDDRAFGLVVGASDIYVSGTSYAAWGAPVRVHSGGRDAFVAKLNAAGGLTWNTFLGGDDDDPSYGNALGLDADGSVYLAGESYASWGVPVRPHAGSWDAFVAELDSSGTLAWNTFLGGGGRDYGYGLVVDSGSLLVVGGSAASWGTPLRPFAGTSSDDAFVARLGPAGSPAPTFTGFSPASARVGTLVAIDGTNLGQATAVTFNGIPAGFSVLSDTQLSATVPKGPTSGRIVITSPGGSATSTTNFTLLRSSCKVTLTLSGLHSGVLRFGRSLTARGKVTSANLGARVVRLTVQRKRGTKWVTVKAVTRALTSTNTYSWKYKPTVRAGFRIRAAVARTATNLAGATTWRSFRVR